MRVVILVDYMILCQKTLNGLSKIESRKRFEATNSTSRDTSSFEA